MKRFLMRLALFGCLQLVVVAYVVKHGEPEYRDHFYCSMYDKVERMDRARGPRLLLVGGSNVAFGIDSRELAQRDFTPVNLGLHAALGLDFYLRLVEKKVRQDDIIVLMLEYELLEGVDNDGVKREMVSACPEYAEFFKPARSIWYAWRKALDKDALPTAHAWVKRSFAKKAAVVQAPPPVTVAQVVYRRSSFNEYGDVVAHVDMPPQPKNELACVNEWDEEAVRQCIQRLNEFDQHCRRRGAQVYFSYPPIPRSRYVGSQQCINHLRTIFERDLQVPQIDLPSDYVFESDQFFDTYYHLTGDAIAQRTRTLAESLRARRVAEARNSSWR